MRANYQTDTGGRLQSVTLYPLDMEKPTLELPDEFDLQTIRDYVVRDGALTYDAYTPAPSVSEQICTLKRQLAETDYIAAKTVDALTGADSLTTLLAALAEARSEYRQILEQRTVWRQKIRELETAEAAAQKEV